MNRSFSTFTKRFLLAASIGLVAIHSPMIVLASEPEDAKETQIQAVEEAEEEFVPEADAENDEDEQPKLEVKPFNIKLPEPTNGKRDVIFIKNANGPESGSEEGKKFNIKIETSGQAGTVDAKGNHLFFVQRGSEKPLKTPIAIPPVLPKEGFRMSGDVNQNGEVTYFVEKLPEATKSPYIIGAELRPLNTTMRWMLKLPEDRGIAVFKIMPDSSAEKAGLKERDILIKADGHILSVPDALIEVLAKSEGKELKITYIRDLEQQKEITTTIKPDKRPESKETTAVIGYTQPGSATWLRQFIHRSGDNTEASGDVLTFSPQGFAMPVPPMTQGQTTVPPEQFHAQTFQFSQAQSTKLPNDLSISISRTGDKPAEIKVKRGDESWEVTEKELDKLPEDIRKHVQGSFSLGTGSGNARYIWNVQPTPAYTGTTIVPAPHITTIPLSGGTAAAAIPQVAPFTPGQPFNLPVAPVAPNAETIREQIMMQQKADAAAIQKKVAEHQKKVQEEIAKAQAAQQAAMQKQMQELQKQVEAIQKQMKEKEKE